MFLLLELLEMMIVLVDVVEDDVAIHASWLLHEHEHHTLLFFDDLLVVLTLCQQSFDYLLVLVLIVSGSSPFGDLEFRAVTSHSVDLNELAANMGDGQLGA